MNDTLRIFVGWDPQETAAYAVLCHSIITRATRPVSITPIARHQLGAIHQRQRDHHASTDFSITRFLVPHLSGYEGWSLWMDADMLVRCDITDLWLDAAANQDKAVLVVKHDYTPRSATKMDGRQQSVYTRKNWSSFVLFNNARCRALTPEYVETAPGLDLHRFAWVKDEEIGGLPIEWNWLSGEYIPNRAARVLHYTLGGPWLDATCDQAGEWLDERRAMLGEAA